MTPEILAALVRHLLTGLGSYWLSQGLLSQDQMEAIAGGVSAAVAVLWSIMHKRGLRTDGLALMVAVLLPACLMVGCTTAIKNGDIVAVKSRVFGISITTSDAGGSPPKIQIGLASTVVQMVPTSTNRLYAPRYADTMDMNTSGNPFHTGWSESTFYEQGFSATNESAAYSTQPERVTVTRPRLPKAITNAEVLNLSTNAL